MGMMMSDQHATVLLPRIKRHIQVLRCLLVMEDVDMAATADGEFVSKLHRG